MDYEIAKFCIGKFVHLSPYFHSLTMYDLLKVKNYELRVATSCIKVDIY